MSDRKYHNLIQALRHYVAYNKDTQLNSFLAGYLEDDWLDKNDACPDCGAAEHHHTFCGLDLLNVSPLKDIKRES